MNKMRTSHNATQDKIRNLDADPDLNAKTIFQIQIKYSSESCFLCVLAVTCVNARYKEQLLCIRDAGRHTKHLQWHLHNTQTDRNAYRQADRQTDKQTHRQTDRQTERQTDRQTNRQTDRQTETQTDR